MSRALAALQDLCATVGTSTDLQLTNDDMSQEYTTIVYHYQVSILTSTWPSIDKRWCVARIYKKNLILPGRNIFTHCEFWHLHWPSIECYITFAENYRNGLSMTKSSPGLPPPCSLIIANLFQTVLHEKLQFNFTNRCGFQIPSRLSYFKHNLVEFCTQGFQIVGFILWICDNRSYSSIFLSFKFSLMFFY